VHKRPSKQAQSEKNRGIFKLIAMQKETKRRRVEREVERVGKPTPQQCLLAV